MSRSDTVQLYMYLFVFVHVCEREREKGARKKKDYHRIKDTIYTLV